jgi:hypothetical protein
LLARVVLLEDIGVEDLIVEHVLLDFARFNGLDAG